MYLIEKRMKYLFVYNPTWLIEEIQLLSKELHLAEELVNELNRMEGLSLLKPGSDIITDATDLYDSLGDMFRAISEFANDSELVERELYMTLKMLQKQADNVFE